MDVTSREYKNKHVKSLNRNCEGKGCRMDWYVNINKVMAVSTEATSPHLIKIARDVECMLSMF
jgi:hypothetical protein